MVGARCQQGLGVAGQGKLQLAGAIIVRLYMCSSISSGPAMPPMQEVVRLMLGVPLGLPINVFSVTL